MLFSGSEFIPRILQEFFEKALRDFELARHDKLYSLWSWGIIWWRVAVYWHIVSNYRHSVITHTQLRYVSVFACLQTNMYIDEKSFKKKHIYWKYRVAIEKILWWPARKVGLVDWMSPWISTCASQRSWSLWLWLCHSWSCLPLFTFR